MDSICVQGGIALQGEVPIQGSKNAALPILAATLLVGERSFIRNCPRIADVYAMVSLLKAMGCQVNWQEQGILVDSSRVQGHEMQSEAVKGMRSSLCLLGAMIGRCNEVVMEHPGGCVIGQRPIDLHLWALGQMGVAFGETQGLLSATADRLCGARICLPKPSVGATENIILAAVMAEGDTLIEGAAREPEIVALCGYLCACGAWIQGAGTACIRIRGGQRLYGTDYTVPADRIVAGTYLFACIAAGGNIFLEHAPGEDMGAVLTVAGRMGARLCTSREGIYVQAPPRPLSTDRIITAPYPGFPTDLQSSALVAAALGEGVTLVEETIFENRFRVVEELRKMGGRMEMLDTGKLLVRGVDTLQGALVEAKELRGGAALVAAALAAKGESVIRGCLYINRGSENICRDFRELGARVIGA